MEHQARSADVRLDPPGAAVPRSSASLRVARIAVDGGQELPGTANFTDRAPSRNVATGVLVDDARFAEEFARHFHGTVGAGLFVIA